MRLYQISYRGRDDAEHKGYDYVASKRRASRLCAKAHRHGVETETLAFDVQPTKRGILTALNRFAGHPDNG